MEIRKIDKQKIIDELKEKGYAGKLVTYQEIQILYREYGIGFSEVDFAQQILGVEYGNYCTCKSSRSRVKILKPEMIIKSEEEKKEIVKQLKEKRICQKINKL